MIESLPLIASAALVGYLVGLTGVGGGALMTPVLILGFGINPIVAIATDLLFATITKLFATVVHGSKKSVDWNTAKKLWSGSIPGVAIGFGFVLLIGTQIEAAITWLLAIILLLTAISMFFGFNVSFKAKPTNQARLGGGFIGFAVSTTSVGAGALGMALLRLLLGDKHPQKLVGTDLVHAIPVALLAGSGYAFAGFLDIGLLGVMLLGAVPAAILGSFSSFRLNGAVLRKILAIVLLLASLLIAAESVGLF